MKKKLLLCCFSVGMAVFSLNVFASTSQELSDFLKNTNAKIGIIKKPNGFLHHDYIVPAGPYYQLFDWDMYFMSVALSYDHVSAPVEGSVADFLDYVDVNANNAGYVPREIAPEGFWALPEQAKPFLAQAAVRASQTSGDFSWIKPYFEKLAMTLEFWEDDRKASDGLFIWYNGTESGADNNPAVSSRPSQITEGVDLQVYIYREYLALAKISAQLNQTEDEDNFRAKARDLKEKIISLMWDEHDQTFYNINSRTGDKIRIKTWTNLTPLWGKVLDKTNPQEAIMAKKLIESHLLNPQEFWAPFGIRTIAPTEPLYSPQDGYWQGPVWILSNWMMMHALMNYGYPTEALEMAHKTVNMLVADFKDSGGMNECYNPETGDTTAAGNFVSWNLLAEHMIDEALTDQDPASF